MKHWFQHTKRWSLAIASAATLTIGAMVLLSCGGEGGPIGSGGGGGGNNSFTAQFMALLPAGQAGATYVGPDTCKTCHNGAGTGVYKGRLVSTEPYFDEWHATKHATKNVACEQCHGPGSIHAANPATDNILTGANSGSPIICAQCHGPIYDQWYSSKHRQLIVAPVEEAATTPAQYGRSSRCIQCHSGLFRTMTAEKGVDVGTMTDQQIIDLSEETVNNVPHIASCNTCHNPHKQTGNLTGNGKEVQLRHLTFNTDTAPVGASQPASSFVNYNHICAQCHNGRGVDPSDAKLTTGTARPSMHDSNQFQMLMGFGGVEGSGVVQRNTAHATAPGQCSHCHMPNSSHTFTTNLETSCAPCHTATDAAARLLDARSQMINNLYALLTRMRAWSQTTFGDPDLWDYTTNIQALTPPKTPPNQTLVPIQIKRARHNYFFIIRDACFGPHNYPYAVTLLTVANQNLDTLGVPGAPAPGRGVEPTTAQKLAILKDQLARWQKVDHESGE
jgi:hypothetical protein